jgi:hypothetical protein
MRRPVEIERVAMDDLKPPGIGPGDLGQRGQAAGVLFHRHDPARAFGQKPAREPAGAGPDLQHVRSRKVARHPRDLGGEVEVEEEVLPQGLRAESPWVAMTSRRGGRVSMALMRGHRGAGGWRRLGA